MRKSLVIGAFALLGAISTLWIAQSVSAQSGFRGPTVRTQRRLSPEEFRTALWKFIADGKTGYKSWTSWPGRNGIYEGKSPHGAFLKMYANRTAAFSPKELPHGSVIVKENYGPDKETLMAVTVMYRSRGYDPKHNDWYWIKYLPDGKVATTPPEKGAKPIAGKFPSCIECHSSAAGNDFAFANDE